MSCFLFGGEEAVSNSPQNANVNPVPGDDGMRGKRSIRGAAPRSRAVDVVGGGEIRTPPPHRFSGHATGISPVNDAVSDYELNEGGDTRGIRRGEETRGECALHNLTRKECQPATPGVSAPASANKQTNKQVPYPRRLRNI